MWEIAKEMGPVYDKNNKETMAILKAEVKGLKSQPHSNPNLAEMGHLEYDWSKKCLVKTSSKREKN